ncbi:MAG TPA: lysozyme inhibitor LprI family protein [Allosphingosinicella sp.]|jgi:uncharacterized protein YecT (DUF1311 family)
MSLFVLALLASAAPECKRAVAQPDLNACAAAAYSTADAALNRQWALTLKAVRKDDELGERVERLRTAQRAWVTFRDAHCDSAYYSGIGASLDYTLNIHCRTAVTKERTRQLAELAREH